MWVSSVSTRDWNTRVTGKILRNDLYWVRPSYVYKRLHLMRLDMVAGNPFCSNYLHLNISDTPNPLSTIETNYSKTSLASHLQSRVIGKLSYTQRHSTASCWTKNQMKLRRSQCKNEAALIWVVMRILSCRIKR